jgi:hypothetical protein
MARTVQLIVPPEETTHVLGLVQNLPGVHGIKLQKGVSLSPPGDEITVDLVSTRLPELMRRIKATKCFSVVTRDSLSYIIKGSGKINTDPNVAAWEEIEWLLGKESNINNIQMILVMFACGIIAACGMITNALHLVIGAMMIAPGFEPLLRMSLGVVTRSRSFEQGFKDALKGYTAMILGAMLATWVFMLCKEPVPEGKGLYLASHSLLQFWTSTSVPSVMVTAAASIAGTLLVILNRSVLTSGVMVALALIPTATFFGMGLATTDWQLAQNALLQFSLQVSMVLIISMLIFSLKQLLVERRTMIA